MNTRVEIGRTARDERWFCRLLWILSFVAFLPIALVARLTGWHWRPWAPGPDGYQSVFREAAAIADVIVGQSLNGY